MHSASDVAMPSVAAYALGLVGANATVSLVVTPPLGATPHADPDSAVNALAVAPWTRNDRVAGADPGLAPFATVTDCDSVVPVGTLLRTSTGRSAREGELVSQRRLSQRDHVRGVERNVGGDRHLR